MNKEDYKGWLGFAICICIMLIIASTILAYFEGRNKGAKIDIPNSWMIDKYCKEKGYENGWLSSSSCGINEVQCHEKILGLERFECVKWEGLK